MENSEGSPVILKENFQAQLSELEMLQSAFCNPGEIKIEDYLAIADMHDFINDKIKFLPSRLNYTINLKIDNVITYICITLPHMYPTSKPDVFVRFVSQNHIEEHKLNIDLKNFILNLENTNICIFEIITWLQDNIINYIKNKNEIKQAVEHKTQKGDSCSRYWIYSHHIYNKTKRKEILNLANTYSLTGFCLPGKPGVICVEGFSNECNNFWLYIKSLTWQKIICKHIETDAGNNIQNFRKFKIFEEIAFQTEGNRANHMNMGEFKGYLDSHECEYIFNQLFGLEGKTN